MSFRERMSGHEQSHADLDMLQFCQRDGLFPKSDYPIRLTVPDLCWPLQRVAVFLDGEEVHDPDKDAEIDAVLIRRGWTVIRERYRGQLSMARKLKILKKIKIALGVPT